MSTLCAACLDAPAEYQGVQRLPPQILEGLLDPAATGVIAVPEPYPTSIPFNIPFRADDVTSPLKANFILDLNPRERETGLNLVGFDTVGPVATPYFEQQDRQYEFDWDVGAVPPSPGCHSLTLILTYADNIPGLYLPEDHEQAAWTTWWFNFEDPNGPTTVDTCPTGSDPL